MILSTLTAILWAISYNICPYNETATPQLCCIRFPPPPPQDGDTGRQHFVFNPFKHRHSKKMSVEVRNGERIINSFPFNSFCFAEKLTESPKGYYIRIYMVSHILWYIVETAWGTNCGLQRHYASTIWNIAGLYIERLSMSIEFHKHFSKLAVLHTCIFKTPTNSLQ